jgi:hypothetical protein
MQEYSVLAINLHERLLQFKRQLGYAMFAIAEILKEIKDKELYVPLGYESFAEYVNNPEIGMNSRTAYYYIQIYETFIEGLGYTAEQLQEYSYDRLRKLAPIVRKQLQEASGGVQEVSEVMDDAAALRWYDFEKKYKDIEKNEGHEEYLEAPEYYRCEKCGKWLISIPLEDCCDDWLLAVHKELSKRFDKVEGKE